MLVVSLIIFFKFIVTHVNLNYFVTFSDSGRELTALKISFAQKIGRCSELESENKFALEAARSFRTQIIEMKRETDRFVEELRVLQHKYEDLASHYNVLIEVHNLCKFNISDKERQVVKYREDGFTSELTICELEKEIIRLREGKDEEKKTWEFIQRERPLIER